jgi:phenylalanyl-tRNA synthetase beta subunit
MLTEKEIEKAFSDVTHNLEKKFGAVLRGQYDSVAG